MAKFFAVTLTTTAIVQVGDHDTAFDAAEVAERNRRDIINDCGDMDVGVEGEVTRQGQLSLYGWDGMCLPYGGDGNTRLQELLPQDTPAGVKASDERQQFEAAMGEALKADQGEYALSRAHQPGQPYTFLATQWAWSAWQRAHGVKTPLEGQS